MNLFSVLLFTASVLRIQPENDCAALLSPPDDHKAVAVVEPAMQLTDSAPFKTIDVAKSVMSPLRLRLNDSAPFKTTDLAESAMQPVKLRLTDFAPFKAIDMAESVTQLNNSAPSKAETAVQPFQPRLNDSVYFDPDKLQLDYGNCHLERDHIGLCSVSLCSNDTFAYLRIADLTADGGKGHYCYDHNALHIDANPYDTWAPPSPMSFLDHFKHALISTAPTAVPHLGDLSVEFKAKVSLHGLDEGPFPPQVQSDSNDYRLVSGILLLVDEDTGLVFGFVVTNDRVYAVYQRFRAHGEDNHRTLVFTMVVPLAVRVRDKYDRMRVILDSRTRQVYYMVDDVPLYTVQNVGYIQDRLLLVSDSGGTRELAWPESVKIVFGCATFLDYYLTAKDPACRNPFTCAETCGFRCVLIGLTNASSAGAPPIYDPGGYEEYPANYWDPIRNRPCHHIWGQGADLDLREIRIGKHVFS